MILHKPFILLFTAFWIAMGCFFIPQSVQASTVAALSDEQLVDMSSCILHATIIRTEPVQFDSHTILTKVTVQVHENLKCDAAIENDSFQFYVRGGSIDDFTQTVSGEFNAVPDDEIVVFLRHVQRYQNAYMVLGMKQGAFVIKDIPQTRADRKQSKSVIKRQIADIVPNHALPESRFAQSETLSDLKQAIRDQIQTNRARHE